MKNLILVVMFILLSFASNAQKKNVPLTGKDSTNIEQLKSVVEPFPEEIRKPFKSLIECWYHIARNKGKNSEQAFLYTLNNLAGEVKKFDKHN